MSEPVKEKIAAIVVTYNRKLLLGECLDSLLNQTHPLDAIFIIDNASADGTPEFLVGKGFIDKPLYQDKEPVEAIRVIPLPLFSDKTIEIHYVKMHENTGGAGGFHEGVKRGYESGYAWLWLMDDDAEPKEDALEKLKEYLDVKGLSALAPVVMDKKGNISFLHRGYINLQKIFPLIQTPLAEKEYLTKSSIIIDMASFVGILVSRKTILTIGYPMKSFFIHHDDIEYCIRMQKVGKILLVSDSIIIHKEEKRKEDQGKKIFFSIPERIPYRRYWLVYYGKRNLTWLGKTYGTSIITFSLRLLLEYLLSAIAILLFDDHKIKRITFLTAAFLDGLKGNFNNNKPKTILYNQNT